MSYSLDLRKRVVEWMEEGGSVSKAAKIYKVGRATIYRWMSREELRPTKVERRNRKLNWDALRKDVEENPETKLEDRAQKFGVRPSALCYALKQMKMTRKKKNYVIEKETDNRESNIIEDIQNWLKNLGVRISVYLDESGFEEIETRIYAWSKRGKKVYGEKLLKARKKYF